MKMFSSTPTFSLDGHIGLWGGAPDMDEDAFTPRDLQETWKACRSHVSIGNRDGDDVESHLELLDFKLDEPDLSRIQNRVREDEDTGLLNFDAKSKQLWVSLFLRKARLDRLEHILIQMGSFREAHRAVTHLSFHWPFNSDGNHGEGGKKYSETSFREGAPALVGLQGVTVEREGRA